MVSLIEALALVIGYGVLATLSITGLGVITHKIIKHVLRAREGAEQQGE